ncbi:hypothetical protein FDECE_4497 [Fusarium decemcellulare]|nr:hypothetical protein FDECE_4497 [Fusarium decemcellulare]
MADSPFAPTYSKPIAMELQLPMRDFCHRSSLRLPYFQPPEGIKPSARQDIAFFMSFHGESHNGSVGDDDLDAINAVRGDNSWTLTRDSWLAGRSSAKTAGDSPFWGPSAFQPAGGFESLKFTSISKTIWKQAITTEAKRDSTHFSGSLGIGIGRSFLGASVTGQFDKFVDQCQDLRSQACKDSASTKYMDSIVRPKTQRRFSEAAKRLLQEHGPEMFETVFGTHFVSGFVLGCESGYLISLQEDREEERNSFTLIGEIHALFWSVSASTKVAENFHSSFQHKLRITSYDTLNEGLESGQEEMSWDQFVQRSMRIRERLKSVEKRVSQAKTRLKSFRADPGSELVLEILLSPWNILEEWQAGNHVWHQRESLRL